MKSDTTKDVPGTEVTDVGMEEEEELMKEDGPTTGVQSMKNANYGDLRLPNIMIKDSEVDSEFPTPIILDFDWAGIDGEVKYPVNLNKVVDWPDTAKSGLPILNSHDMYMVENLFTYCQ